MSQPRKHHYLPQFYLRGFSLDGRGLHQIEKLTGRHYPCQIKDAAAVKDFHALDQEGVEDPHALEKHLAAVEDKFARHLAVFLSEGVANEMARQSTVQLLSLLRLRVPAFKEYVEASHLSVVRETAAQMERQGRFQPVPPGLENVLRLENLKFSILNWACMEHIFRLAGSDDILSTLYGMKSTLYTAPPGMSFVTCDQPVAMYHPQAAQTSYGIGIVVPGTELTLPLSSSKLLLLHHSHAPHQARAALPNEVNEFNRRTVTMARRFVFAAAYSDSCAKLAEATRDVQAGFVFDDIGQGGGMVQLHRFLAIGPANG
jgi:hypothetical protein